MFYGVVVEDGAEYNDECSPGVGGFVVIVNMMVRESLSKSYVIIRAKHRLLDGYYMGGSEALFNVSKYFVVTTVPVGRRVWVMS